MAEKRITFLLPGRAAMPIGGFKVVYEYANRLAADGFSVTLMYPKDIFITERSLGRQLIQFAKYIVVKLFALHRPRWFALDKRVAQVWTLTLSSEALLESDRVVATAWDTADFLMRCSDIPKERKFYLIQGYETWAAEEERVLATWKAPLQKIVIAPWMLDIAHSLGQKAELICNGFDFDTFYTSVPPQERDKHTVLMMYNPAPAKGCRDGLDALAVVKERYPQLQVLLFGAFSHPAGLPRWVEYYHRPEPQVHHALYNRAAVFVAPSHTEGWGLTVGEAMQCSCAVACSENKGHMVVARDGHTALVSPVKAPEALAANIMRLISDDELRCRIAEEGNNMIRQYTWDKAYKKFVKVVWSE